MEVISRTIEIQLLLAKLKHNPAVVILGARQIGKTTIAKELAEHLDHEVVYFDLEQRTTAEAIRLDIASFLLTYTESLIILDEVQVLPDLFSELRAVIDLDRRGGRFMLLGSANPSLVKGVSESLTGRTSYYQLPHLKLVEVGYDQYRALWYRGGFPVSFLAESDSVAHGWLVDYIKAYTERDIRLLFGVNVNSLAIYRLWSMIASLHGTTMQATKLARSVGVSTTTSNIYIDLLEAAFLIYRLPPWYANVGKRLTKASKVYISDTGLLHALLQVKSFDQLLLHPIIGNSWEGFVIQQIRYILKESFQFYFYRTSNGAEIDLLLVQGITPVVAIEIKNSNNPSIPKGFYNCIQDLKTEHNYIITRDSDAFYVKDIMIIGLTDFLKNELPKLVE